MTHEETIEDLVAVVRAGVDMRLKQALYFKTRHTPELIASKNAEKHFDAVAGQAITRHAMHFSHRNNNEGAT